MKGYIPRRPEGTSQEMLYHKAVWDALFGKQSRFNNSATVKVDIGPGGYTWHAAPASSARQTIDNYPFKIYVAQADQLAEDSAPDDASRSFLVREGRYGTSKVTGDGMDGYDLNPDSDFFPTVDVVPIVVPEDAEAFYFWIELTVAGPVLRYGETPASNPDSIRQWTTYPKNDGYHIIIGELNIVTDEQGNDEIIPRQLQRTDIAVPLEVTGCDKTGQQITYEFSGASLKPTTP